MYRDKSTLGTGISIDLMQKRQEKAPQEKKPLRSDCRKSGCWNFAMYQMNDKILAFLPPESIEPEAKARLTNISELPFVFHHVAVMPDCHLGKGATVGSVIATQGAIIPAAVEVDVGCGMVAVKTKFLAKDLPDNLDKLRTGIERRIPLGAGFIEQLLNSFLQQSRHCFVNNVFVSRI